MTDIGRRCLNEYIIVGYSKTFDAQTGLSITNSLRYTLLKFL